MTRLIPSIQKVLEKDRRVVFAYLYGSILEGGEYRDVDVGIYADPESDPFGVTGDLKIALSRETGFPPDRFDIQVINRADNLLFLQQVLNGRLLVDRGGEVRGDFIESFSMRYRESEGILSEAFGYPSLRDGCPVHPDKTRAKARGYQNPPSKTG